MCVAPERGEDKVCPQCQKMQWLQVGGPRGELRGRSRRKERRGGITSWPDSATVVQLLTMIRDSLSFGLTPPPNLHKWLNLCGYPLPCLCHGGNLTFIPASTARTAQLENSPVLTACVWQWRGNMNEGKNGSCHGLLDKEEGRNISFSPLWHKVDCKNSREEPSRRVRPVGRRSPEWE